MTEVPEPRSARSLQPHEAAPDAGEALDSPETVVRALYDVLSGPAESERERDWDRLRSLLLPEARFLIARWPGPDGSPVEHLREWDVEGFIQDARQFYSSDGFWEREVWGRTDRFGNVAHRFSSYESRVGSEDSEPVGRGVNSFQLVRFGTRWWIASVAWDIETPDQAIPEEYLNG